VLIGSAVEGETVMYMVNCCGINPPRPFSDALTRTLVMRITRVAWVPGGSIATPSQSIAFEAAATGCPCHTL
jgi:hypothetical protein